MRPTAALAAAAGAGLAVVAVFAWADLANARASRRGLPPTPTTPADRCAVVVLGYRDAGPNAGTVNRWRALVGVRTARREAALGTREVVLICSGGAVGGAIPEADLLAAHARALGWTGALVTETTSRSTRENVAHTLPLLAGADRIVFASHPGHAERARALLREQELALVPALARAEDHRWGEQWWLKPGVACIAWRDRVRHPLR